MENQVLTKLQNKVFDMSNNVNKCLGSGHTERIYHKALICELNCNNFIIDCERHVPVKYIDSKGFIHFLESERIDIFIHNNENYNEGNIILELKAIQKPIQEQEKIQIKKYFNELKKDNIEISYGIIINFPQPSSKETRKNIDFEVVKNKV